MPRLSRDRGALLSTRGPHEHARVRPMRRLPFFFAYFWFPPDTGGWTNVRT